MSAYRYSCWDGSQRSFPFDDVAIMEEISEQLLMGDRLAGSSKTVAFAYT